MCTDAEEKVHHVLRQAGITYTRHTHPPVFTVEEAEREWEAIPGAHCKNLFLRNKKGNHHYLVILLSAKRVDIRLLERLLGEDRLSFGSAERLKEHLGLEAGAVSPFGLLHDRSHAVRVVIDSDLKTYKQVSFHPNVNTATITLSVADFQRFLASCGNPTRYLAFPP
ncbi:MAG: prolyl-tRNA synthetase associated domain-containing protein [Coprothermobacterota bacterium]|nr:prolyl-tRNA synthetase associated domain-containing protein [Coprothermobacterota bacterium]